jgi:hypothetical protein
MKRKLKAKIVQEYGTQVRFCRHTNIQPGKLSNYLRGHVELKPDEIKAIREALYLTERKFNELAKDYNGALDAGM